MKTPLTCLTCGLPELSIDLFNDEDISYIQVWCTNCKQPFMDTEINKEVAESYLENRRNNQEIEPKSN